MGCKKVFRDSSRLVMNSRILHFGIFRITSESDLIADIAARYLFRLFCSGIRNFVKKQYLFDDGYNFDVQFASLNVPETDLTRSFLQDASCFPP